jgi:hypothetical protein
MADESELRRMLEREASASPAPELDTAGLVRRTRARRLPRQLAAGGVVTLAVVGLGVGTVTGVRMLNPLSELSSAGSGAESSDTEATDEGVGTLSEPSPELESEEDSGGGAAGGAIELAPAYKINLCGGVLSVPPEDVVSGVSVEVEFPQTADLSSTVQGSVEITNDTGEPLRGVMSDIAATTLSQDDVVLWHTPRMERTLPVDLAPGESTTLDASFEPVVCSVEDDGREDFPADLPPVDAGQYDVSVAFDIEREDGVVLQVVSGTEPISLR